MEVDFVTCPKCKCKNWIDIPNTEDKTKFKFRCSRCSYTITLGSCAKCRTEKAWIQTSGIDEKGGRHPVYRFQCRSCKREIGLLIDRV